VCRALWHEKDRTENEWRTKIKQSQARHVQLIQELQSAHDKRFKSSEVLLHEVEDRKQIRIQQIEKMKLQIIVERDVAIASTEKRFHEIQLENEQKRIHLQDEHGNKMKECSTL
jgi:hypothetical protein